MNGRYGRGMSRTDIDLNLLVVLDALLGERNVTRAGVRLGMSQPTTSRALARLRKMFDDPLLIRVGRQMQLTPRAESLAPQIREVLEVADRALRETPDFDPATTTRSFLVSCSDYVTQVLMGRAISEIRRTAPKLEVHLLPYRSDARELLRRNEIDIVVEPRALRRFEGLECQDLFGDRWRCAIAADSDLATGDLDLATFLATPYLTYSLGRARGANLADRELQRLGLVMTPAVTTENLVLVPSLLRDSDMISLVPERMMPVGDGSGVVLRDPPFAIPKVVETMYWSRRNADDPAHAWFRSTIAGVAGAL